MALLGDIRFALRTMASNRTTTIVAVVALSLGMGANATVFSIVNGALFKNMLLVGDDILYLSTRDLAHGQKRGGVVVPGFSRLAGAPCQSVSQHGSLSLPERES